MRKLKYLDESIAVKYGVAAAFLLEDIYFWVSKNETDKRNFRDSRFWTYNTVKTYTEKFPFLSRHQINTALSKLESEGVIIFGNYNEWKTDRTRWIALSDSGYQLFKKSEMEYAENGNGIPKNGNCNSQNENPISLNLVSDFPNRDSNTILYTDILYTDTDQIKTQINKKPLVRGTADSPETKTHEEEIKTTLCVWDECYDKRWRSTIPHRKPPEKRVHDLKEGSKRWNAIVYLLDKYGLDNVLNAISVIDEYKPRSRLGEIVSLFDWFIQEAHFELLLDYFKKMKK